MERSRLDLRTVALAILCLTVLAFAAATLDTTTDPDAEFGSGSGIGDESGVAGTPTPGNPGSTDDGRRSLLDIDGGPLGVCVEWLTRPLVRVGLLGGLVALFLLGRWYDEDLFGLALVFSAGYPGFFAYLLLTSCQLGSSRLLPDLSRIGSPVREDTGGLIGGQGSVTPPTLASHLLLVLVVLLLGVVAVGVLTGDRRQSDSGEHERPDEPETPEEQRADVATIGEAAGRAADRIEREGEFENEVYRAWAEMTEPLAVDKPESSTPGEFAAAARNAGMAGDDVDQLTRLFAAVRYGGADPTPERERTAVETLRQIERTYTDREAAP